MCWHAYCSPRMDLKANYAFLFHRHVPMLKLLLENGADLYAINNVRIQAMPQCNMLSKLLLMQFYHLHFQDGNTPYSLALSGGNMDTANYVMTYASKSPQRDSGGPVKIYNMQVKYS